MDTMEKSGNAKCNNWQWHIAELFGICLVSLTIILGVSGSCEYNPSEIQFEHLKHSKNLDSNFTELQFRTFVGIPLAGCEKECGLRRQCSMYSYHWVMHLCELFDLDLSDPEFQSLVMPASQFVLRRMDDLTRQDILTDCGAIDCPVGTVCSCGHSLVQKCEIRECPRPGQSDSVIILGNLYGVGNKISSVCAPGYAPVSDVGVSRVCQQNGLWSGTEPLCATACDPLTPPENGDVVVSARNVYPSLAQFTCDPGHTLVGSAVLMCMQDGNWDSSAPSCIQDSLVGINCDALVAPDKGSVSVTGTIVGSTATYTCEEGYELLGSASLECTESGLWSEAPPQCELITCTSPDSPNNGSVTTMDGTSFGSTVAFSCEDGFNLVGEWTAECLNDGSWSSPPPQCVIKDCGPLESPTDGTVSITDGTTFGASANFDCNNLFDLVGEAVLDCLSTGVWSDSPPQCVSRNCGQIAAPENGSLSTSDGTWVGTLATFSCEMGFELIGEETLQCLDNRTWSGDAPECIIRDCGPLEDPVDGSVSTDATTFNSFADYSCVVGYDLIGTPMLQCLETGTWSHSPPECRIKDCMGPPEVENGFVFANSTTYGSNAYYSCADGYDLHSPSQITCLANGSWSSFDMYCKRRAKMFQPCSTHDDCWETDSMCRDGQCGCRLGLSYVPAENACKDSVAGGCLANGTTFQIFDQHYLFRENNISFYGYTLDQCKYACIERNDCLSADYRSATKACHLSKKSAATDPDSMSREADDPVVYLHRDCACSSPEQDCYGCGIRPPVADASLINMILPEGAILGTEKGVTLTYRCNFRHHVQGQTTIESVCEEGIWTNLDVACMDESYNHPCTTDSDCLEPNSVCRDLVCSCMIGYSYSQTEFRCLQDCPEFGTTFQTVSNHLFSAGPDPNVILTSHTDIDLDDCKVKCSEAVKFDGRECKSASYNENHRECTTFSVSASTMPENLFEEWGVTYLHRDCVCPEDNALCSGCGERSPVPQARLTEVHLPEGALWGTELGVVNVFKCRNGFDFQGSTTIESTCSAYGWTNETVECIGDTIHHECTNDSDCVATISECRATEDANLKKCGCIIGSGYFPDDHGCFQAACPAYGSTFQVYPSTRLVDDKALLLEEHSLDECKDACVKNDPASIGYDVIYASFNYNFATRVCELSEISAVSGRTEMIGDVFYYQRDCAAESGDTDLGNTDFGIQGWFDDE